MKVSARTGRATRADLGRWTFRGDNPLKSRNPRILIVTPEITYLPQAMGSMAMLLKAKAGGLADVSASLVTALFGLGADVHVALPHYRSMFHVDIARFMHHELRTYRKVLPKTRIHLAEDRVFYYRDAVYSRHGFESHKIALAFQREVINNIVPLVNPDLIHCNDWMTGLIPAMARRLGIPALFTVHNIHTHEMTLAAIEDGGIDAARFWHHLYFKRLPHNYEETRADNPVDFLASGIFAAHFVNTVSPTFLNEVCEGRHGFLPWAFRSELLAKKTAGYARGILNAPDPSYNPSSDDLIEYRYSADNAVAGKLQNKRELQDRLGLIGDDAAPLFFWPSRLDPVQKGCQLLTKILYEVVSSYWKDNLQIVLVANGPYQRHFHDIVRQHGFLERVAVCDFEEGLSHLAYAASDFLLMPSLFEPCGLPQMIGAIYGSLPIVRDTGGLHDTVTMLDVERNAGNGFVFEVFDAPGLRWAIDRAMEFYRRPAEVKAVQIARVMREGAAKFNHPVTAREYIDLYETMLCRPIVKAV